MDKIAIIGVPMDLGANRRGVDMGPSAIRITKFYEKLRSLGHDVVDRGDIAVPIPEASDVGDASKKYAATIEAVCERLASAVYECMCEGRKPIVLGGDHSVAMGSVAGAARYFRERGREIGIVWVDAHGDMNVPESSSTGNVHGMSLSHTIGLGDPALAGIAGFSGKASTERICLIGARDLDDAERDIVRRSGIKVFTMKEIDRFGAAKVFEEAISLAADRTAGVHVSFDIDAVDPTFAPGVGTPERGGLSYREAHLFMELVADRGVLISMDMVEVNPVLDERNATADLAGELILSAFGKRII